MATVSTTGALASPGVGSGLDVNAIVSKLMAVESQPLTALAQTEASYQAKISAYGTLKGGLAALQSSLAGLVSAASMRGVTASIADAAVASVSAGTGAAPGTYALTVTQLAQSHKIASTGFAGVNDVVGTGTLTFDFGTVSGATFATNGAGAKTVTIGAGRATLAGIRDAVNAAGIGVSATIVNDGSVNGNRLVFTSVATGAANSLKVTTADDDGNALDAAGLSQLAYDPAGGAGTGRNMTQMVVAQNALLTIDGIDVSKASNVVTDAIEGVTLNLAKANPATPTTLTVVADSSGISRSVQGFVKAYNELAASIKTLTKYDAANRKASILTGDSAPRIVQSQLRSIIGSAPLGIGGAYGTLSQVGVSFLVDGTLNLDSAKLTAAVTADPAAVARLFAAVGTVSDSLLSVDVTGTSAQAGTYAVDIAQLATRGAAVGTGAAGLAITAGVNDELVLSVDGVAATVTLAPGTYASAAALATDLQARINGSGGFAANGSSVTVTQSAGILTLASARYGSQSTVTVSGNAAAGLFGGAATETAGVDVAGSIGGFAARGIGQTLFGAAGTAVDGMHVQVSGGTTGARGDITYTQGYASRLDRALASLLGNDGVVAASTTGVTRRIADIGHRREQMSSRLAKLEQTYRAQFQTLDTLLSQMSTTSTALQQQLASLPKISQN